MSYRVCQARLLGVPDAVDLFAVSHPTTEVRILHELDRYEQALQLWESGRLDEADRLLANSPCHTDEVPIRFLAEQVRLGQGQQLGRRRTDPTGAVIDPAIAIDVK